MNNERNFALGMITARRLVVRGPKGYVQNMGKAGALFSLFGFCISLPLVHVAEVHIGRDMT